MAHVQHSKLSQFELILNPVRMRIIQSIMLHTRLTTRQIAEIQPDIPLTTLYRHLNMLVEGGILVVAGEHRIRGTVERSYELAAIQAAALDRNTSNDQTTEDQMRLFTVFVTLLLDNFRRYLEQADQHANFATDGVSYRQFPLQLSDAEFNACFAELNAVIDRWQALEPSSERIPRLLSLITLPERT